jgi:hypothetical protein
VSENASLNCVNARKDIVVPHVKYNEKPRERRVTGPALAIVLIAMGRLCYLPAIHVSVRVLAG